MNCRTPSRVRQCLLVSPLVAETSSHERKLEMRLSLGAKKSLRSPPRVRCTAGENAALGREGRAGPGSAELHGRLTTGFRS